MPLYDFRCEAGCGYYADMYIPLKQFNKAVCPKCKGTITTVIGTVPTIGPLPSKPLKVHQVGREFTSNAEFKQYQRDNPGCEILSADSAAWRKHTDMVREKAEATAKRRGYRDLEQQRAERKVEKAKQDGRLDKKVFV